MRTQELLATARARAGLDDLGDERILEGLEQLVASINASARLTEAGEQRMAEQILQNLTNRLRVVDYLKQHPELMERPIEKPLFVFGLPRTGTTLAINLLNEDPARRSFRRFESLNSVPPPKPDYQDDERFVAEKARLDMALKYMPHIAAIHFEEADGPSECQFSMSQSFCAQVYDSTVHVPDYHRWFLAADYLPAFEYHKQLLQLLQAETPGRWILKNPWHPLFLDTLHAVYPDAQLVMTHRDPAEVVGSAASLVWNVQVMFSDHVDKAAIAENLIETFDAMIARAAAYKAKHGEEAIYDLHYAALMRDPIGEMRKLYAHFGEPFTAEAETAMQAYMAGNPQGKHGRHKYTLEEFGLTKAGVRAHFRDYSERLGIELRD